MRQDEARDHLSVEERQVEHGARTATTAAGEIGQRQTSEELSANVAPTERINSRVENRVQNRIRNRIDRSYDPQANATSPFKAASEQKAQAGRRSPRR